MLSLLAQQVVFEALRCVFGEGAVHNAAARYGWPLTGLLHARVLHCQHSLVGEPHSVCRVESHLSQLHLQPQQASAQSAADQLADILTGCKITDVQVVQQHF